ncbi:MAG: tetratricopeptide repeat protein [Bacteroidetes bacterium]|nr:tetratricopeptide repeat protein [Bacteroidota bacterium]MBU1798517.1 tetratricopeptide repeat protein [Bacteroidota bacterium]
MNIINTTLQVFFTLFIIQIFTLQHAKAQHTLSDTLIINSLIKDADSVMVNNPKLAISLADSASVIANELNVEKFNNLCLRKLTESYYALGKYQKVINNLFILLKVYEANKDSAQIALCNNDIGTAYTDLQEYSLALSYLYKAMVYYENKVDDKDKATTISNIGYTYLSMKDYEGALPYFQKVLPIFTKLDYQIGVSTTNNNIGRTLVGQKRYTEAIPYFKTALSINTKLNQKDGMAMTINHLGLIDYYLKNYDEAIVYFQKAAKIRKEIGNMNAYFYSMNNIAYITNLKGKPKKAIEIYENLLAETDPENDSDAIIMLLTNMNKNYASIGEYDKAYETLLKCTELKDKYFDIEKNKQIEELKVEFETEQHISEINNLKELTSIQEESLNRKQMIILLLIGSFLLVAGLGYLGITRYQLKTKQKSMELEQKLLRSQMNPHFIFNSLSVIQGYIFKGSANEAVTYLSNFGKLMRNILENSREEFVLLEKEIETLKHYLKLQNLRHDGIINYTIEIDENLGLDSVRVPPMLAQPFIENSIKHGMNEENKFNIQIKYTKKDDKMKLVIEDDGIGINKIDNNKSSLNKHQSLAITITQSRLQLLSKRKKGKFNLLLIDLSTENTDKSGTRIELDLPYLEEF